MPFKHQGKNKLVRPPGLFITFEGTEGSGKTMQCRRLARSLRSQGYQVLHTREPGGTPLAETIRRLLLSHSKAISRGEAITPGCETALILAARSQHVAHIIRPALRKGFIVICDRFFDSTLAYQGYGRNLDQTFLYHAHQFANEGLTPDLTFLLDLPIKEGLARRWKAKTQNRMDKESLNFHQRVRKGFCALAKQHPRRIRKLDARYPPDVLTEQISAMAATLIEGRRLFRRLRHQSPPLNETVD